MNEPSKEHQQVHVESSVMDKYVGAYRTNEYVIMTVKRDGDHLVMQMTGQGPVPHFPQSDTEYFAKIIDATISFVLNAQGHTTALVLHQGGRDRTMPRIDASTAEKIEAMTEAKVRNQTPTPGSDAALKRLIAGLESGNPNYSEMSPELAEATRDQLPRLHAGLTRMGGVQSLQFLGVGNQGWDTYSVRYERGSSIWRISLTSDGQIYGALVTSGP